MQFVSLISDFGHESHYIGLCKLAIRQQLPSANIIDITHDIKPFSSAETCYVFQACQGKFPENCAHFVLSDLYATQSDQLIYAVENNQHIFGVDNGIIPELFHDKAFELFRLKNPSKDKTPLGIVTAFAEKLSGIFKGQKDEIEAINVNEIAQAKELRSIYNEDDIIAQVIHIDRFENIILNVKENQFEEARAGRNFSIQFPNGDEITTLSKNYSSVESTQKLAFFNASGFLEVAINHANAAGLFGFKPHNNMLHFYKTMKIVFT